MAAARCIAAHRTYLGWDVFHEETHNGINWTARKEGYGKLRADSLAGIKEAIRTSNAIFKWD